MRHHGMAIGEISRRTGCNIQTIRYYEQIGLMPSPERRGRFRRYGTEDVRRLVFVRRARELGFALDEVRALLKLSETNDARACGEVREIGAAHLADIRKRIADLRGMERVLGSTIHQCDAGQQPSCPLIDALSR